MKNLLLVKGVHLKSLSKEYFHVILEQKMDKHFFSLNTQKISLNFSIDKKSHNIFRINTSKFNSTEQIAAELYYHTSKSQVDFKIDKLVFIMVSFKNYPF
jgi:hypothetical protein